MSSARRQLRGYTLIELMMAIVIGGTLAALAIPRYATAIQNYRVDAAANQVMADLNYARTAALRSSASRTIEFSVSGGTYSVSGETDPNHPSASYVTNLTLSPYFASIASATFGNGTSAVFNGYGIPTCSGSVVVQVGPTTRQINLSADSGIASVQ